MIRVVKRDGRVERLDIRKIQKYTADAVAGLKNVSQSELEVDAKLQFRDMISSEDIQQTMIKTAVDKIDMDRPDWTFVASRLFLYDLYHKVSRFTGYIHLREYFERGEQEGRILLGLKEKYDLDKLNSYIRPERDLQFTYLGIKTLYDRYLLKDRENNPIELPQHLFMGVAMFLAQNEEDRELWAKRFYDILSKFEVMSATPTLSNARTSRHQLSSCFPKGEKILTYEGFKNIEDIQSGDFVLTHKNRFKQVYEVFKRRYSKKLYSFDIAGFEKNTLRCTEEHPILTLSKEEIKCIRKGKLCIVNQGKYRQCFKLKKEYKDDCKLLNHDFSSTLEWKEAQNIKKGDFLQVSYPTYTHNKTEILVSDYLKLKDIDIVDNQISPIKNIIPLNNSFMRLIGYYLADGYINRDLTSVHFTFGSKEQDYIQDSVNIIKELFDIKSIVSENRDNSTNVSIHNKLFATFLYELVGSGFNKKYLSEIILYAKNQKHILVGAFRGDGCTLDNGIALSLSNKELIKQLYNIALREGLTPKIRVPHLPKLATTQPYVLELLYLNDGEFIEFIGKDLHKIEVKSVNKNGFTVGRQINQFWFNNNFFARVKGINREDTDEVVYNLEVEDDHSYVMNNIAVHNCFLGSTPDNIEGIFDAYKEMALLSKFGGGIGWDWSQVRGMGSSIDGHKHAAGGIIPFLKITNDVAIAVDQLGCVAKNSYVRVKGEENIDVVPISEVQEGSLVESFNIELNRVEYRKVETVHELQVQRENQIKIIFQDGYIVTSKWHPMAIKGKNGYLYKRSDEVKVGEFGVNYRGEADEIIAIDTNPNISEEYIDLTVHGTNNYFASTDKSDNFYLTHNTRKGAIAVYIEPWHIDIRDFLDLKKNSGEERRRGHDLFPALWINDIFMERVQNDDIWTLFDPYEVQELTTLYGENFRKRYLELEQTKGITKDVVSAKGLWKEILRSYFETGNPFLTFKDNANRANPNKHTGVIRSSNLCVTGDTRLHTQFGLVKAQDLEENYGELVATYDNRTDGDLSKYGVNGAKSLKMFKTKTDADIYEVVTKDGYRIKSTLWHEYYIADGAKVEKRSLKDISIGDKLLIQSGEGQFGIEGSYNLGLLLAKNRDSVPETIFKGNRDCVVGYLQALFSESEDKLELKARREFLEDIQIILANFGISSKLDGSLRIDKHSEVKFLKTIISLGINEVADREFNDNSFLVEISEINHIGKEDVYDTTQLYNHSLIFNGIVTGNCTEIFQNTSPNHYKIRVTYVDKSIDVFEEEEFVTLDSGTTKMAKKITALDTLNGKQVWMVDKAKYDGETAVCNLASINLSKINSVEDIARVVPTAIRMLDNVIDLNFYPLGKVKKTNEATRAIGLGVMGEAQMLAEKGIKWGSNEHLHKIDEIMESVSYYAIKSSSDLAMEKGSYPNFEGSEWSRGIFPIDNANREALGLVQRNYTHNWMELREQVKANGMRNGYLMAIAPTSSISILTGTTQAIEPVYKRKWFEENLSGLIPVVVPNLSPDTWEFYTPSYELNQNLLIRAGAVRQKWIDQGQSLNIFITLDRASGRYLNEIYMNGWRLGLKSTYYLRSQSPETTNDIEDRSQECAGCQ